MKQKLSILLILISLVSLGCSKNTNIVPQAPVSSSDTPTITLIQNTTSTPKATKTLTHDPFAVTLQANQTQNAVHQITSIAQQTKIALTPTVTRAPTYTPVPTSIFGINEEVFEANYSPNGDWVAFIPKSGKPEMYVSNKEATLEWYINYFCENEGCQPGAWIVPLRWTADNKFFFFGLQVSIDGAGIFLQDGIAIRRLNLETGDISDYLPAHTHYYAFSFSPSGRTLIYIPQVGYSLQIIFQDIQTGGIQEYSLNPMFAVAGRIVWFQDETKIAFLATNGLEHDDNNLVYFIMIFDLSTQAFSSVYQGAIRYDPIAWLSNTELIVKTSDETLLLNTTTQVISPYTEE